MRLYPISKLVHEILKINPHARDNDKWLIYLVWIRETEHINTILSYENIEELSNPGTITRAKRNLQRKYPKLRGKKYCQYYLSKFLKESCKLNI